jgi:chromosome segregation ATPase
MFNTIKEKLTDLESLLNSIKTALDEVKAATDFSDKKGKLQVLQSKVETLNTNKSKIKAEINALNVDVLGDKQKTELETLKTNITKQLDEIEQNIQAWQTLLQDIDTKDEEEIRGIIDGLNRDEKIVGLEEQINVFVVQFGTLQQPVEQQQQNEQALLDQLKGFTTSLEEVNKKIQDLRSGISTNDITLLADYLNKIGLNNFIPVKLLEGNKTVAEDCVKAIITQLHSVHGKLSNYVANGYKSADAFILYYKTLQASNNAFKSKVEQLGLSADLTANVQVNGKGENVTFDALKNKIEATIQKYEGRRTELQAEQNLIDELKAIDLTQKSITEITNALNSVANVKITGNDSYPNIIAAKDEIQKIVTFINVTVTNLSSPITEDNIQQNQEELLALNTALETKIRAIFPSKQLDGSESDVYKELIANSDVIGRQLNIFIDNKANLEALRTFNRGLPDLSPITDNNDIIKLLSDQGKFDIGSTTNVINRLNENHFKCNRATHFLRAYEDIANDYIGKISLIRLYNLYYELKDYTAQGKQEANLIVNYYEALQKLYDGFKGEIDKLGFGGSIRMNLANRNSISIDELSAEIENTKQKFTARQQELQSEEQVISELQNIANTIPQQTADTDLTSSMRTEPNAVAELTVKLTALVVGQKIAGNDNYPNIIAAKTEIERILTYTANKVEALTKEEINVSNFEQLQEEKDKLSRLHNALETKIREIFPEKSLGGRPESAVYSELITSCAMIKDRLQRLQAEQELINVLKSIANTIPQQQETGTEETVSVLTLLKV